MSEAPERIWAYNITDGYGLWKPTDEKHDTVEYVRADRIEELEARLKTITERNDLVEYANAELGEKLAKAVEALSAIEGWSNNPRIGEFASETIAELTGGKDE